MLALLIFCMTHAKTSASTSQIPPYHNRIHHTAESDTYYHFGPATNPPRIKSPMETIDSTIGRLHSEIAQCKAKLQVLQEQLQKAESDKLNRSSRESAQAADTFNGRHLLASAGLDAAKSPRPLSNTEYKRYGRQLILPEVGLKGIYVSLLLNGFLPSTRSHLSNPQSQI